MTLTEHNSYRIARRAGYQGACSAEVSTSASVYEKSATKLPNKNLIKCKRNTIISTFNIRTLNKIQQIPELISSAIEHNIDVICLQEHRALHPELDIKIHSKYKGWTLATASAWTNSMNATMGGVGLLLSPTAKKSLISIEKITPRIIIATFEGNPKTSIISCYSPTNHSDETDIELFYEDLSKNTM